MTHILHIDSSIFGDNGTSSRLAAEFVAQLRQRDSASSVTYRNLAQDPVPHLDAATFSAALTPVAERDAEQHKRAALADRLVDELLGADILVLGVPMYNFQVPSTLKAWFDHVARAGTTFRYTANGPEGLVATQQAYVFTARGGVYPVEADTQTPYLRQFLGFLGIDDVTVRHAEGLAMGDEARQQGVASVRGEIERLSRGAVTPGSIAVSDAIAG